MRAKQNGDASTTGRFRNHCRPRARFCPPLVSHIVSTPRKLHAGALTPDDLFHVAQKGDSSKYQIQALKSFAIWGFYLSLIGLTFFVLFLLMPAVK